MSELPGSPLSRRRRAARREQALPSEVPGPHAAGVPVDGPLADGSVAVGSAAGATSVPTDQSQSHRTSDGTEIGRPGRLRRRPRRPADSPTSVDEIETADIEMDDPVAPIEQQFRPVRDRRAEASERALRGLVTTRGTQVSWSAATRARVYAAPSADDMAAAEAEVVVVRRNYTPAEPLRTARTPPAGSNIRPHHEPGPPAK